MCSRPKTCMRFQRHGQPKRGKSALNQNPRGAFGAPPGPIGSAWGCMGFATPSPRFSQPRGGSSDVLSGACFALGVCVEKSRQQGGPRPHGKTPGGLQEGLRKHPGRPKEGPTKTHTGRPREGPMKPLGSPRNTPGNPQEVPRTDLGRSQEILRKPQKGSGKPWEGPTQGALVRPREGARNAPRRRPQNAPRGPQGGLS